MAKAIKKYGWDNIEHEVVASNLNKDEASNFERLLISKLHSTVNENGYNIRMGGYEGSHIDTSQIIELWNQGFCVKDIVHETGHSRDTVRRALFNEGVAPQDV